MDKITFLSLLRSVKGIRIPKIQREYVQGLNERGLRFVEDIFRFIQAKKQLTLDLVYGTKNSDGVFKPIDGQQRLTTLFLLYWYIGKVEKRLDDNLNLTKFSYETRDSSKAFCAALCDEKAGANDAFSITSEDIPSESIKNSYWYYMKYRSDYTVKSMLSMLDIIHNEYKKTGGNLFDSLENYIYFYIYEMSDYSRDEKLYVIMNDRGLKLTPYENLKCSLLNWINARANDDTKLSLDLSTRLDNTWSDFVWRNYGHDNNNKPEKNHEANTDNRMFRLIIRYLWNLFALVAEDNLEESVINDIVNNKKTDIDFKTYISPNLDKVLANTYLDKIDDFCADMILFFEYLFENQRNPALEAPWKEKADDILEDEYNLSSRVAYLGLYIYLSNNRTDSLNNNSSSWESWNRFVWNIIDSTNAKDSIKNALRAMKLIWKYKDHANKIEDKLAEANDNSVVNDGISDSDEINAEKYEICKAKYIHDVINKCADKDIAAEWRAAFYKAGEHKYLKGYIDFLIRKTDSNDIYSDDTYEQFCGRWFKTSCIFSENNDESPYGGFNSGNNHLVIRALLSKLDRDNLNEEDTYFSFCSYDTKRSVLKNSIKHFWQDAIKQLIVVDKDEKTDNELETELMGALRNAVNNPVQSRDNDWNYWCKELCSNTDLVNWIQNRAKKRKTKASLKKCQAGWRVYFNDWNSNGKHIILNTEWYVWIEGIKSKGYTIQTLDEKDDGIPMFFCKERSDGLKEYILYFSSGSKLYLKKDEKHKVETINTKKVKVNSETITKGDTDDAESFRDLILNKL